MINFVLKIAGTTRSLFLSLFSKLRASIDLRKVKHSKSGLYVITSKNDFMGTSISDIANPAFVTEIATELIVTRLFLIDLLNSNRIDKNVVVVCAAERRILYTKIFPNVITYDQFKLLNIKSKNVLDLLSKGIFQKLAGGKVSSRIIPYLPVYKNWRRDKADILNFQEGDIDHLDLSRPFVALVIRLRGAWPEKNMTNDFWEELINCFTETDIQVFVFGREAEKFCNNQSVIHVSSFQDWCTLTKSPNLRHIGSTMTGAVYPALIFGSNSTKITLIDNLNLMSQHGHDPSFYHSSINFAGCPIEFITSIPSPREYFNVLTDNL